MKKPSIFPRIPKNLSVPELRKEIRRRLKISDQLGHIKQPKKWSAGLRLVLAGNAKSHPWTAKEDADYMGGCPCQGKITPTTSTAIAPRNREGKLLRATPTSSTSNLCWYGLKWLSQSDVSEIRCFEVFEFIVAQNFASPWKQYSAINLSISNCL